MGNFLYVCSSSLGQATSGDRKEKGWGLGERDRGKKQGKEERKEMGERKEEGMGILRF